LLGLQGKENDTYVLGRHARLSSIELGKSPQGKQRTANQNEKAIAREKKRGTQRGGCIPGTSCFSPAPPVGKSGGFRRRKKRKGGARLGGKTLWENVLDQRIGGPKKESNLLMKKRGKSPKQRGRRVTYLRREC